MRRVGTKRTNSENITSWDQPPTKRPRVDTTRKKGPTVWSRITSSFGGLFSSVKNLFRRPGQRSDSNSRTPYMNSTLSSSLPGLASSSSSPSSPPHPQSHLHSKSLTSLPIHTTLPPSASPPPLPPSPTPPPPLSHSPPLLKAASPTASVPTHRLSQSHVLPRSLLHKMPHSFSREPKKLFQKGAQFPPPPPPVLRRGYSGSSTNGSSSSRLWTIEQPPLVDETTQHERWTRVFPTSSSPPPITHHSPSSHLTSPHSPLLSSPPPPPPPPPSAPYLASFFSLISPPYSGPPESTGPRKKRVEHLSYPLALQATATSPITATAKPPHPPPPPLPPTSLPRHISSLSSSSSSAATALATTVPRAGLTHSSSLYHPLPHSPPPSPLPSSDVVQRKKWVESLKADHTHSLSQHRAAVELERRLLAQCRERRFRAEDSRVRNIQESVQNMSLLSGDFTGEDDEEEEADEENEGGKEMMGMTEEQLQMVKFALSQGPGLEILGQKFNISIKRDDVRTLAGLNWLNDEVINFYMNLIMERGKQEDSVCRVHAMSSFFYPKLCDTGYSGVRRWTKKVDIFSMDLVLYPIHLGTHWCLAAVDNRQRSITYYDSLGGRGGLCLTALREYLVAEHKDKKKTELSLGGWRDVVAKNVPQQKNGSDCGVFMLMYARHLSSNSAFNFSQEDMPEIRRHIICELLQQRLF